MKAQEWRTPIIKGYGKIVNYENAAIKPNPELEYKYFFHITKAKEREGVNDLLWKIARTINLLEDSGVPKKNIKIAAVISGDAYPIAFSKEAYVKRYNKENPNLDLIDKLTNYGVSINFCGQTVAGKKIDSETELNTNIKLTLSALIDITTYQMQGYTIIN